MKISKQQLNTLKEAIDKNLELRCINVETKLEYDEEKNKFHLSSTKFVTVPSLHSNLSVTNFGGGISKDEEDKKKIHVGMSVHADYDGNGTGLFDIHAITRKGDDESIWIKTITHGDRF